MIRDAFYYSRVLENPVCRWSTWDAVRVGENLDQIYQLQFKKELGLHQFG